MTVSLNVTSEPPVTAVNGVDTYSFGFEIADINSVMVEVQAADGSAVTPLSQNGDYSVTAADAPDVGGSVNITAAVTAGDKVVVYRSTALVQGTDLPNQGAYFAQDVERALDRGMLVSQEQEEVIGRGLRLRRGEVVIPGSVPVGRADGTFDPAGVSVDGIAAQVAAVQTALDDAVDAAVAAAVARTAAENAAAAAASGVTAAEAAAVAAVAAQAAAEDAAANVTSGSVTAISMADFGSNADGVTADDAALTAALAQAATDGVGVYFPEGAYLFEQNHIIDRETTFAYGATMRAGNGAVVSMDRPWVAPLWQIFDTSLGGTFVGSVLLSSGYWSEWFGTNPRNTGINDGAATNRAIAFVQQTMVIAGGNGNAEIKFSPGAYTIDEQLLVAESGIGFSGTGNAENTMFYITGTFDAIRPIGGTVGGTGASYGISIENIKFQYSQPLLSAGAAIHTTEVQEIKIKDCAFYDCFRGIVWEGNEGSHVHQISGCNFVSSVATGTPAVGSGEIFLLGHSGGVTGLSERSYVTRNTGTSVVHEYGIYADGIDVAHVTSNHFAGMSIATLRHVIDGAKLKNIYNWTGSNNIWEGLTGYAQYAVLITVNGDATLDNITFDNDMFFNGSVAALKITSSNAAVQFAGTVKVTNCTFKQMNGDGIVIEVGKQILIANNQMIDGDIEGRGDTSWIVVGNGSTVPEDVTIIGNQTRQDARNQGPPANFPATVSKGLWVRSGKAITAIGNTFHDCVDSIVNDAGAALLATDNRVEENRNAIVTQTGGNTFAPPVGVDMLYYDTDNATGIAFFDLNVATKGRRFQVRATGGGTLEHYTGGGATAGKIWVRGGANRALSGYEMLDFVYDEQSGLLVEL